MKRFEDIEKRISENQTNNHKFLMDEYPSFEPKPEQRIKMTEAAVRDLCLGKVKNPKAAEQENANGPR